MAERLREVFRDLVARAERRNIGCLDGAVRGALVPDPGIALIDAPRLDPAEALVVEVAHAEAVRRARVKEDPVRGGMAIDDGPALALAHLLEFGVVEEPEERHRPGDCRDGQRNRPFHVCSPQQPREQYCGQEDRHRR